MAVTRFFALARSPWDWDEMLFSLALRDFNVAAHHPHPPGFPGYVALAKVVRLFVDSDFHAIQGVNLIAAMLALPAMYLLARALRFDFATSLTAGVIFEFLPNVWLYGGTGLSDEPSAVVLLFAIAFLLRPKWYFLGCVLLGIALTFRPQSALMAVYPWLAASWPRFRARRYDPLLGALVVIVICAVAYGIAAFLTGWDQYRMAVRLHGEYIASVDSFRNPARPPVLEVARRYAIDPFFARRRAIVLAFFAIIGLLRFRRGTREAILIFGPFFVFACFMFDFIALSRYSIAYMPLTAILAADGIAVVSFRRGVLQAAFAVAAIAPLVPMTWRAMAEVRAHDAPPAAAAQWIRTHVDRRTATIYVHDSVSPHAEYFLSDYRQVPVDDTFSPAIVTTSRNAWLFREGATSAAGAVNFHREHGDLWDIVRRRYFDVSVRPLAADIAFADGWYPEESAGETTWRWMGGRSRTLVPVLAGGGELTMHFYFPLDAGLHPTVRVLFNGVLVDQFAATRADVDWKRVLPSRASGTNELIIEVSETINPAQRHLGGDTRDLGLRLSGLTWKPASAH